MWRLPPNRLMDFLPDFPENCSALFLSTMDTAQVLVDNLDFPKLLAVTYKTTPSLYFVYGEPTQYFSIKRFVTGLRKETDLVIPSVLLNSLKKFWPIRFSIPISFFAAEDGWQPKAMEKTWDDFQLKVLTSDEAPFFKKFFPDHGWLWEFYTSPEHLLVQGQAVGAFINRDMVCVAVTLAFTPRYMEVGVVTSPEYRGHGLAFTCSLLLCKEQYERYGRLPCWRTQAGNIGSVRVAKNLGLKEAAASGRYTFISNYKHLGSLATVAP